jgi:hypothetical protein
LVKHQKVLITHAWTGYHLKSLCENEKALRIGGRLGRDVYSQHCLLSSLALTQSVKSTFIVVSSTSSDLVFHTRRK